MAVFCGVLVFSQAFVVLLHNTFSGLLGDVVLLCIECVFVHTFDFYGKPLCIDCGFSVFSFKGLDFKEMQTSPVIFSWDSLLPENLCEVVPPDVWAEVGTQSLKLHDS